MRTRQRAGKLAAALVLVGAGIVAGFALATAPSASGAAVQEAAPATVASGRDMPAMVPQGQFVTVAEQMAPTVVFIEAERPRERGEGGRFDGFFEDFFGRAPDLFRNDPEGEGDPEDDGDLPFDDLARSQGSGVIVSPDGLILTNAHVVASVNVRTQAEDLATTVRVTLQDESTYDARIIGADLGTDIALLKVDATALPYARLGDSSEIRVGEWVMAVGAPFGLQNTVSAGIVSALGRASLSGLTTPYQDFIQTDAAINPGNSGGPLVNLHGEVVGINTAIATGGGIRPGFAGVGFAVPANVARGVMEQLREHGRVIRGYLGVTVQPLTRDQREGFGLDPGTRGAIINQVTEDGPAQDAGVEPGDIVVGMDGDALSSQQDFLQRIAARQPGDTVRLEILRGVEEIEIPVTLTQRPDEASIIANQLAPQAQPRPEREEDPQVTSSVRSLGLRVTDLNGRLRDQLRIHEDIDGVVITGLAPNSPAAHAGLETGDVIMKVRQAEIGSVDDFLAEMETFEAGDMVALFVYDRSLDNTLYVPLRIPRD